MSDIDNTTCPINLRRAEMMHSRKKAFSVSFDMGLLEGPLDENRLKKAAKLFQGHLGRCLDSEENFKSTKEASKTAEKLVEEPEEESCARKFDPDWSGFESAFAKDLTFNADGSETTVSFLTEIMDLLLDYVHKMNDRSTKVLDFHHPHQLKESLGHCLDIPETPRDLEQVLSDCKETLKYGVKTGHPRFFNQLSSGLDIIALAGEWLTATANTNMFTYEIAPVFTLMEEVTLQKMREHVGWLEGDGIFAPGGAISNLYAVLAARYDKFPELKTSGMTNAVKMVMFTSEQAHYSIKRAAAICGIGTDNVKLIKCDERGKMSISELRAAIEESRANGEFPFFVSATCGTTVLGAFDPVDELADLCAEYDIWLHADCAWGGGVLVTRKYKHLVKGISRVDSLTWNPHKAMGVTLQCSAILLRKPGVLSACNSMNATYLFQKDKQYDTSYDTGDKTIQCGRHNDVFKLWLMWRAKGDEGFEQQINRLFELSEYLQDKIRNRPGFEFVLDKPEYLNVCFWYTPVNMRDLPAGPELDQKINTVAPKIKAMMMEAGSTMVGYQPLGDKPNFFRMIVSNVNIRLDDIDFLLDEIEKFGEEI